MEKYKTEFKLKVVKSFLAGDGGAKLLARRWTVPEEKIRTWVSHYRLHGIDGLTLPLNSILHRLLPMRTFCLAAVPRSSVAQTSLAT